MFEYVGEGGIPMRIDTKLLMTVNSGGKDFEVLYCLKGGEQKEFLFKNHIHFFID